MDLNQITLPALDMEESVAFYRRMGFRQIVDSPHYARFETSSGESTFSLHRADAPAEYSGVVIYFECDNLDEQVRRLRAEGFQFSQLPTEQPWLWTEARLFDPAHNEICLYWAGENRKHPPWRL